jgi:uncharacterized protein YbaR (Trm112 family)
MYLPLTDWLACPHCGPTWGLIVLAEQIQDRRVLEGALGCPNCQREYPIRGGVPDLRREPGPTAVFGAGNSSGDLLRLAAMLGITEGRGYALLLGAPANQAAALADLITGLEVIASGPGVERGPEQRGVNRVQVDGVLPLRDGSVRGVVLGAGVPEALQQEALRVLMIGGRLVISRALPGAESMARANVVREDARDENDIVATRIR